MTMSAGLLALSEIGGAAPSVPGEMNSLQEKSIEWKNSALIVVDMQNDFVRKGAPLEVPTALGTAAAQKALILAFRNRKLPIVYTKFISHPHYYLLWEWSPQCQPPTKCCWKGHQRNYADINATREALVKRDEADSSRKTSPLAKADDAVEVDTSDLTLQQVIECVVTLVEEKRAGK